MEESFFIGAKSAFTGECTSTGYQPRMRTNTRINTDAPGITEIIATIKSLPSDKAAGIDGIPNWCGICVLPAVSKIKAKVILERIRDSFLSKFGAEQAGFRASSSCTDRINSVWIIIEQWKEFRSDLHMIFIDFEKAFDSVHRD